MLAAASLAVAGPASADVSGSTSTQDVVLFDHCQQHPISYDLRVGPGTLLWRLEIQVADPQGQVSEGTVVNSATNPTSSGTVQVTFCGSERAGTYTVRGTGFYQIIPAVQLPFALPETSFQVRPAATRTALAEKSLGHGRYQLTTRVREESETGFRRANGVPVRLERLVSGAVEAGPQRHADHRARPGRGPDRRASRPAAARRRTRAQQHRRVNIENRHALTGLVWNRSPSHDEPFPPRSAAPTPGGAGDPALPGRAHRGCARPPLRKGPRPAPVVLRRTTTASTRPTAPCSVASSSSSVAARARRASRAPCRGGRRSAPRPAR